MKSEKHLKSEKHMENTLQKWKAHLKSEKHTPKVKAPEKWKAHEKQMKSEKHLKSEKHTSKVKAPEKWKAHEKQMKSAWKLHENHMLFMKSVCFSKDHLQGIVTLCFGNFFVNFLLDKGPFCGPTDYPYFGLCVTIHMGFKARMVLSPALLLSCTEPTGATPAFFTNRGVHCIVTFWTSLMQAAERRQWWISDLGSSEIQSWATHLTS